MIVTAALQEDANVIALSTLNNTHMTVFPKVLDLIKKNKMQNILLTGGGIISKTDMEKLNSIGIGKLFGPGTPIQETIDYITNWVKNNYDQ